MTETTARDRLVKSMAETAQERREADPHGFWDMSERQLVEWLGGNNAVPGSVTYEQARLVLEQKRHETERDERKNAEVRQQMRQRMEQRFAAMEPEPTNGKFFGLLALIIAVGGAIGVVLPATVARVVVAVIVVLVLAALVVPAVRRPVSRWLDRTFG